MAHHPGAKVVKTAEDCQDKDASKQHSFPIDGNNGMDWAV
jgi:hypothetical protein